MNSSQHAQRSNRTFFAASVAISAVLLAASGFFLNNLLKGGSDKSVKLAEKTCVSNFKANGWNPDLSKAGEVKVNRAELDRVEALVYESGVLIANCPAHSLTDYCAGAACPNPGVTFTLKSKKEL